MRKLKSPLLDLDQMIKKSDMYPYQLTRFNKAVLHINHNPAVQNKQAILPAISASIDFTNQYPAIITASSSYASFNVRKGMQLSLLSTVRKESLKDLYYKFMFQVYPQHLNSIDTSIPSNIFKILPQSGNFHIGLSLSSKVSGNLAFVFKSSNREINRFFLSY